MSNIFGKANSNKKNKQVFNNTNSIIILPTNNTNSSPENLSFSDDEENNKNIPRNTIINDNDLTILDYHYKQNQNSSKKSEKIFGFSLMKKMNLNYDEKAENFNNEHIYGDIEKNFNADSNDHESTPDPDDKANFYLDNNYNKKTNNPSISLSLPKKMETDLILTNIIRSESNSFSNVIKALNRTETNFYSKKVEPNSVFNLRSTNANEVIALEKFNSEGISKNSQNPSQAIQTNHYVTNKNSMNDIISLEKFNSERVSKHSNNLSQIYSHKITKSIQNSSSKKLDYKSAPNLKGTNTQIESLGLGEEFNFPENYFIESKE